MRLKFVIYILLSERDGGIFIGHTSDLETALQEHERGAKRETKYRLPVKLIHKEHVKSFKQVKMREAYWRSEKGHREIERWVGKLPDPYARVSRRR